MWSRWAVQVTKGGVVNATTSLPLRWHCLWLNHLNHFNEHPFVLRHIVGAIRTCLLNLSSTSQKIKVSMLLLISFDGWNVGMVLGSLTADIILFIWIFVCQIAMAMVWYDDARCCIDMMIRYYDSWRSLQYWMQHTWDTEILQSNGPTIVSYKWKALQRRASNNSCWGS